MIEQTAIHEAGHAILRTIEQEHIGPVLWMTVLPCEDALGLVCGAGGDLGEMTPRKLRAAGRTAVAGVVAVELAGFNSLNRIDGTDKRALGLAALLSGQAAAFVRECRAGADLHLRANWGAVLRLADWVRSAGTLTPPYAGELVRMALEAPPRPLAPDIDTFIRLVSDLEDVPEFAQQFESAARTLSAAVA